MTDEELEAWITSVLDSVARSFAASGRIVPCAIILAAVDPRNGQALLSPSTIGVIPDEFTPETKDAFAEAVRSTASAAKALGLVFVSEIWARFPESEEEAKAILARGGLSKDPKAKEGILLSFERQGRSTGRFWLAEITRDADGKRTLGTFKEQDTSRAEGRFIGLLEQGN